MNKFRQLALIEAISIGSLVVLAGLLALVAYIDETSPNSVFPPAESAYMTFSYASIIGLPIVVLFGSPGYWALTRFGRAHWLIVLLMGIAPGALFLFVDMSLGGWAIASGAIVASLTHLFYIFITNKLVRKK